MHKNAMGPGACAPLAWWGRAHNRYILGGTDSPDTFAHRYSQIQIITDTGCPQIQIPTDTVVCNWKIDTGCPQDTDTLQILLVGPFDKHNSTIIAEILGIFSL